MKTTIYLPLDRVFYGADATQADAEYVAHALADEIGRRWSDVEVVFFPDPVCNWPDGTGPLAEEIERWIDESWREKRFWPSRPTGKSG